MAHTSRPPSLTCAPTSRFRNLEFLENELEAYYQAEQEKLEAQEKRLEKMRKRLA